MDIFVSKLFEERPEKWGLRGDSFLWAELSEYFSKVLFPCSQEAFQMEFDDAFFLLTGNTLETTEPFFIPKYDQGGMSSGMIAPAFWKQELLPLLIERLRAILTRLCVSGEPPIKTFCRLKYIRFFKYLYKIL